VKDHAGVTLVHPPSNAAGAVAMQLFNMLGTAVGAETNEAMGTLPVITSLDLLVVSSIKCTWVWVCTQHDSRSTSVSVSTKEQCFRS
jgi:hypothetical protein